MSNTHWPRIDLYEEDPNCAGNRHYDYITVEEHNKAEAELAEIKEYKNLKSHHIVVLRSKAKDLGIIKDIVDHRDRLALLRALFYYVELMQNWHNKYLELKEKHE